MTTRVRWWHEEGWLEGIVQQWLPNEEPYEFPFAVILVTKTFRSKAAPKIGTFTTADLELLTVCRKGRRK